MQKVLGAVAGGQNTGHQTTHANRLLVDSSSVVSNQVDTRNLLKHLVDVGENDTVEVAVFIHSDQIAEADTLIARTASLIAANSE